MPIGEKVLHFENKNADLAALQGKIERRSSAARTR
jgi:hypothetical protein